MAEPLRADHRFIAEIVGTSLGGKVERIPSEFDFIGRVFHRLGGSWERLFKGSPEDVALLKRVVKRSAKLGYLTEKQGWGG